VSRSGNQRIRDYLGGTLGEVTAQVYAGLAGDGREAATAKLRAAGFGQ
jgi:hypothetical protein